MDTTRIETDNATDFGRIMQPDAIACKSPHLNINKDNVQKGLGQLVLTVIKLLHELLERQAIRRIDAGSLTDSQIEELGLTLMRQAEEIERLKEVFGLNESDLNLDLGPLGKLL